MKKLFVSAASILLCILLLCACNAKPTSNSSSTTNLEIQPPIPEESAAAASSDYLPVIKPELPFEAWPTELWPDAFQGLDYDKQKALLDENRSLWAFHDPYLTPWYYVYTDFDRNGRLEVVAVSTKDSVLTYAHCWEVNADLTGIENCCPNSTEPDNSRLWPEIWMTSASIVYHDRDNNLWYFPCQDLDLAENEEFYTQSLLVLHNGNAEWEELAYKDVTWHDGDIMECSFRDSQGNTITEEDYDAAVERRCGGMEASRLILMWTKVNGAEPLGGSLPEMISDGASEVLTSMLSSTSGYLLKKGYPAAGQMQSTLYSTDDGQTWNLVRELHDDVHNFPKQLYFWSENDGIILTDYHGYSDCVYRTQDGGKTWNPVTIDLPPEISEVISGYSYLEGENVIMHDAGAIIVELSAHFEWQDPRKISVRIDDGVSSTYFDDMGSELVLSNDNGKTCDVWFGVHKVSAFEKTIGEYNPNTGVLHFTAQDGDGKSVQAEVRTEGNHLVVTITNWDYEEYLPNGTELVFYKHN